jgi:hypothetical protein
MNRWQFRWQAKRILQRLAVAEARIDALEKKLRVAEGLVGEERETTTRVVTKPEPREPKPVRKPEPREQKPVRKGNSKRRPVKQAAPQNVSEGAKLLAAQMAAAGIPEDEVNAFLTSTFDFEGAEDKGRDATD